MNMLLAFSVFFPMAGGIISYIIGRYNKKIRDYFADGVTAITFGVLLYLLLNVLSGRLPSGGADALTFTIPEICGAGLHFRLDGFRALYGTIAAFMWMISTVYSREYFAHYRNRNRYYLFLLLTLGATLGVFLSDDFITTFLFFEIMSFTSYVWVAHDEKKKSMRAANTYLAVAVIGGLVMLMGIFLLYGMGDMLTSSGRAFEDLIDTYKAAVDSGSQVQKTIVWSAGICMLFGFGAKAGAFPLHIWLPKAHPVAPAPASALLSGILTKAGMFGILILSCYLFLGNKAWGTMILLIGVLTMVVGAVLALFSVDLKRTLACSSVSQIGFILVGVGMSGLLGEENVLAVRGSLLHMVNHSLIKLVLFLAAGVVFMNVHKLDLNEIRGFGRKKPLLNYIFLMGALGIGGVPLWNGYISKTLIHESIVEYIEQLKILQYVSAIPPEWYRDYLSLGIMRGIEWAFLISGGLTVAYMTKLYMVLFMEKNRDAAVQERFDAQKGTYMNKVSACALTLSATLLPIMGILPTKVMNAMADMGQGFFNCEETEEVAYFSLTNLRGAVISLLIGILIYIVIVRQWMIKKEQGASVYVNRWNPYMDLENLIYRPILLRLLPFLCGMICRVLDSLVDTVVVVLRKTIYRDSKLPQELPEGNYLTHLLGCFMNGVQKAANATIWKRKVRNVDYEHKYAMLYEEWSEESTIIGRSLSFGLILFCAGLMVTVIYLLLQ